jgi:hypothetical protein
VRDQRLVKAIVAVLEEGGPVNDPRPYDRSISLSDHVRNEVHRSLNRIRMLRTYKPSTEGTAETKTPDGKFVIQKVERPNLTLADCREAAKTLRKVAFTEEQREAIRQLEAVWQGPPEHADALKYHCAKEMYFLMEGFSATEPTGSDEGPFQTGAASIYEAVTGSPPSTMKRSCALVLRERQRTPARFFR